MSSGHGSYQNILDTGLSLKEVTTDLGLEKTSARGKKKAVNMWQNIIYIYSPFDIGVTIVV